MLNNRQIQDLTGIIEEASALLLDYYYKKDLEVNVKSDQSPVTEADLASNQLITAFLKKEYPEIPVISEETADSGPGALANGSRFWILDPLDGTREFIARNDEFAINLALIEHNQPIFGLISVPVLGRVYMAQKGSGSWLIRGEKRPVRLPLSQPEKNTNNLVALISRSHSGEEEARYLDSLKAKGYTLEVRPTGSSVKHTVLAEGKAHLYAKPGTCWEWDTAPGQLILEEAGGAVVEMHSGQPLRYQKPQFRNPHLIMWAPGVSPVR